MRESDLLLSRLKGRELGSRDPLLVPLSAIVRSNAECELISGQSLCSDFHIAGESYCGRYIPTFADYIVVQNNLECVLALPPPSAVPLVYIHPNVLLIIE